MEEKIKPQERKNTDTKINEIEKIIKQIETEKDFNKVVEYFSAAAGMIKQLLSEGKEQKGRILEIIRDLDGYIEKEVNVDGDV